MKNLKKLTVVLFATLLSFNFTSCIDDGVSDAVDQVYLAQAQFLLAQAALKDADAQYQLAKAASELADAAYTDAQTANQEAVTAQFIANAALQNSANEAAQAFNAAMNALVLAQAQAQNEIAMQQLATALAAAQTAHDVAMAQLAEAVQNAKDQILFGLYGKLATADNKLDALMATKLSLQADLALKQLLLSAPNNEITWAFAQAALEGTLAGYVADLAAAEASLAAVQAATPSAGQQQLTDLEDQIEVLEGDADALEVTLAEAENAEAAALAQWNTDNADFGDINTKMGEIAYVENEIQDHMDDIDDLQDDIDDTRDVIDNQIPAADQAIIDATDDANQAIADAVDAKNAANDAKDVAKGVRDDAKDDWDAAEVLEADALQAWNDAIFYYDDATWGIPLIAALEGFYSGTQNALDTYVPGTPIVDLEAAVLVANAEEEAATAAWVADPAGVTWYDGVDTAANPWPFESDVIGDHTTTVSPTSFVEVLTWEPATTAPARMMPATWDTVLMDNMPANAGPTTHHDYNARTWAGAEGISVANSLDANRHYYLEVEADDNSLLNWFRLQFARVNAQSAQSALDIELLGIQAVIDARDDALEALEIGYLAIGYEFPADIGTVDFSDIYAVEAYIADREVDYDAAVVVSDDLEVIYDDAVAALGTNHGAPNAGDAYIDPVVTAYDAVWNAKLAVEDARAAKPIAIQDAQDARDLLGVVADLEADILGYMDDIAEIQALMPSHELALAYLEAELAELMIEFGLDPTLFDMEYYFGYVPSYIAWIEAMQATDAVQADIDAIDDQIAALDNIWDAVYWFISDENVTDFNDWQADEIDDLMGTIADLTVSIEEQEVLIALGELDAVAMAAAIAECERKIAVVDVKISIVEGVITSLMDRINTYIN